MRLLSRLNLFTTVFALPREQQLLLLPPVPALSAACCACMEAAEAVAAGLGMDLDKEERRFLLMAALMLPLRKLQVGLCLLHRCSAAPDARCTHNLLRVAPGNDCRASAFVSIYIYP